MIGRCPEFAAADWPRDDAGMHQVLPAAPSELRKVLRQTLAVPGQTAAEVEDSISGFIEYARLMKFDLTRQWWCKQDGRIVGACLCLESPGRTAILLLPHSAVTGVTLDSADSLISHVIADESVRDIQLLQCLLIPGDTSNAAALERQGFTCIADLLYLERELGAGTIPTSSLPPSANWRTYGAESHRQFADTILVTYDGSLDCRGLAGLRDIDDIIAGHRSAGLFDPARWRLLEIEGTIAGCILLAEHPLQRQLELVYMGVCPRFRGRGLGRRLVEAALEMAHRENYQKVTLAVDAANAPVRKIYKSLYFTETARRIAWLRRLITPSGGAR